MYFMHILTPLHTGTTVNFAYIPAIVVPKALLVICVGEQGGDAWAGLATPSIHSMRLFVHPVTTVTVTTLTVTTL